MPLVLPLNWQVVTPCHRF